MDSCCSPCVRSCGHALQGSTQRCRQATCCTATMAHLHALQRWRSRRAGPRHWLRLGSRGVVVQGDCVALLIPCARGGCARAGFPRVSRAYTQWSGGPALPPAGKDSAVDCLARFSKLPSFSRDSTRRMPPPSRPASEPARALVTALGTSMLTAPPQGTAARRAQVWRAFSPGLPVSPWEYSCS